MILSPIGLPLSALDTPALLLDLDKFEHNVDLMARTLRDRKAQWRPHAKAFKCPAIAHILKKAGAIGVTVAKVSEAEVMVAGGIDDVLIAHLVVGPSKAARLAALQRRAEVKVTADHPDHLPPLALAAREAGVTIGVLVDVDLGMKRCGVASPEAAVTLATQIAETPGLRFDGLMGYEGHTLYIANPDEKRQAVRQAIGILLNAKTAVERSGLPCRIVSAGGSGSYQITSGITGVTELQAGGGVFACRYYTELCQVSGHQPAISVLTTVVSRPAPDRAIIDAGQKAISAWVVPAVCADDPNSEILSLSAEHGVIRLGSGHSPKIGDFLSVIPGYSDFTFVLHDRILGQPSGAGRIGLGTLGPRDVAVTKKSARRRQISRKWTLFSKCMHATIRGVVSANCPRPVRRI